MRNFEKDKQSIDSDRVDEELSKLKDVETITLLEYLKSSIEILISLKLEEKETKVEHLLKERIKELANDGQVDLSKSSIEYEKIIQKLEAEVRNHISVQQQMKLYIESYQTKIEELEPFEEKSEELKIQMLKMEQGNKKLQSDIEDLKNVHKEK